MIPAVKLLEPRTEGGVGDAEFDWQLINILWVSLLFLPVLSGTCQTYSFSGT